MELIKVERLDHLGVVGGVIKDLSLIELIDARIAPSEREEITTGQAIAAMILNGLGFANRPISLTPQFFENKPVELLFGSGVTADHFNRFKLGRSLDKVFDYGCDLLFRESLSLGFRLDRHQSVSIMLSHISNSGLCEHNDGLDNLGIRYGYRF